MSEQWKLVPVEPTEEMWEAAKKADCFHASLESYKELYGVDVRRRHALMLAAAPQPPALDGGLETMAVLFHHAEGVTVTLTNAGQRKQDPATYTELVDRAHVARLHAEVAQLRSALKFYADREHYHFESGNWDTVSGEPLNILWHGEEPDFIEDGTVARTALAGTGHSTK